MSRKKKKKNVILDFSKIIFQRIEKDPPRVRFVAPRLNFEFFSANRKVCGVFFPTKIRGGTPDVKTFLGLKMSLRGGPFNGQILTVEFLKIQKKKSFFCSSLFFFSLFSHACDLTLSRVSKMQSLTEQVFGYLRPTLTYANRDQNARKTKRSPKDPLGCAYLEETQPRQKRQALGDITHRHQDTLNYQQVKQSIFFYPHWPPPNFL